VHHKCDDCLSTRLHAFKGKSDFVSQKAQESCLYVFDHDLHWNRPISYNVVDCPAGLTALTGLVPEPSDDKVQGVKVKTTTTTMEDCCEPTCSRVPEVKGSWKQGTMQSIRVTQLASHTSSRQTQCPTRAFIPLHRQHRHLRHLRHLRLRLLQSLLPPLQAPKSVVMEGAMATARAGGVRRASKIAKGVAMGSGVQAKRMP